VQKCGRTTFCTKGTITAINTTIDVGYGTGLARYVDQIIVESVEPNNGPFIGGGDSGSSLVDLNRYPVGLLFAGGNGGLMAVANRIDLVLKRFGVTVDGDSTSPSDTNGPVTSVVSVCPNPTAGATSVVLTATVSDSTTGGSVVTAAEYFINSVGQNGTGTLMNASDGAFNSITENVTASVNVSAYTEPTITLYVRGKDSQNKWGDVNSVVLNVTAAPPPPANTMHVASISVTRESSSSRWRGVASVKIVNASGQSVQGVTVTGNFTGPRTDNNLTATTNSSGQATLRSGWQRNPQGKWCFQVTNVSGGSLTYNSADNVVSQKCE
jgi:hypothetical protein